MSKQKDVQHWAAWCTILAFFFGTVLIGTLVAIKAYFPDFGPKHGETTTTDKSQTPVSSQKPHHKDTPQSTSKIDKLSPGQAQQEKKAIPNNKDVPQVSDEHSGQRQSELAAENIRREKLGREADKVNTKNKIDVDLTYDKACQLASEICSNERADAEFYWDDPRAREEIAAIVKELGGCSRSSAEEVFKRRWGASGRSRYLYPADVINDLLKEKNTKLQAAEQKRIETVAKAQKVRTRELNHFDALCQEEHRRIDDEWRLSIFKINAKYDAMLKG